MLLIFALTYQFSSPDTAPLWRRRRRLRAGQHPPLAELAVALRGRGVVAGICTAVAAFPIAVRAQSTVQTDVRIVVVAAGAAVVPRAVGGFAGVGWGGECEYGKV
jgi:hypothetical protein